jgi:hypothetical protein
LLPKLEEKVWKWLEQKFIDHYLDDPYNLNDIFEAVSYVLMGSTTLGPVHQSSNISSQPKVSSTLISNPTLVKIEAFIAAVVFLSEICKVALQAQNQQAGAKPRSTGAATATGMSALGSSVCNFCSLLGHFIRECEVVAEYTHLGKCKHSLDRKVVLPSEAMVSRSIMDVWLHDRVEEYH